LEKISLKSKNKKGERYEYFCQKESGKKTRGKTGTAAGPDHSRGMKEMAKGVSQR